MAMTTPWSNFAKTGPETWTMRSHGGFRKELLKDINTRINANDHILDVGCGPGMFRSQIPESCVYVGTDLTHEFIQFCRKQFPKDTFHLGNAERIPYSNRSFDLVFSSAVLQHIEEWEKVLKEMVRVSKRWVLCAESAHDGLARILPNERILYHQFNVDDFANEMRQWGTVKWRLLAKTRRGNQIGIFVLKILRE